METLGRFWRDFSKFVLKKAKSTVILIPLVLLQDFLS